MKTFLEYFQHLDEKQIQYGKNANYGQIVFFAGGGGSGKGFSIANFIDASKFKIRDVDALKSQMSKIPSLIAKYPELGKLVLSRPDDVFRLHQIAKAERLPEKQIAAWVGGMKYPETLPNLLFDTTMKDMDDIDQYVPMFTGVGYLPENIHITWVLADYAVAVVRNKKRERVVPDDIMLKTHSGAALTMASILHGGMPKGVNGSFTIILNNPEEVKFYEKDLPNGGGARVVTSVVKDFTYITLKKPGQAMLSFTEMDRAIKEKVLVWVEKNTPKLPQIDRAYGLNSRP